MIEIKHRYTGSTLCSFESVDIKDCLQQAVKSGANLSGADLTGADLRGADLSYADLRGADLSGANLNGAYLYGANLSGADLRGSYLSYANLSGADLRGSYLSDAYLSDADLRGAYLSGEKIAIEPILISGLYWYVTISESFLKIGCQRHRHSEWSKFTDDEIAEMEPRAIKFWKQNKSWLLSACKSHRKESLAYRKSNHEKVYC